VAEPAQQSINIFVSYRRHDSPGHAGRLQDALRRQLGPDRVFYDVTAIAGGVDFKRAIKDASAAPTSSRWSSDRAGCGG